MLFKFCSSFAYMSLSKILYIYCAQTSTNLTSDMIYINVNEPWYKVSVLYVSKNSDNKKDYNKCYKDGWSPVIFACDAGHTDIVKMLKGIEESSNKCNNTGITCNVFLYARIYRRRL